MQFNSREYANIIYRGHSCSKVFFSVRRIYFMYCFDANFLVWMLKLARQILCQYQFSIFFQNNNVSVGIHANGHMNHSILSLYANRQKTKTDFRFRFALSRFVDRLRVAHSTPINNCKLFAFNCMAYSIMSLPIVMHNSCAREARSLPLMRSMNSL